MGVGQTAHIENPAPVSNKYIRCRFIIRRKRRVIDFKGGGLTEQRMVNNGMANGELDALLLVNDVADMSWRTSPSGSFIIRRW